MPDLAAFDLPQDLPDRGPDRFFRLFQNDPAKILGVSMEYILTPETEYEKSGVIPEVVFATGAVVVPGTDELRCYYGGADTTINLATGSVKELVELCLNKGM